MQTNELVKELSQNFIEYAVAVNTDRAIPDATSGLKPVHKRILWSAFEENRTSSKPHVKAARIVGDVMGKYHPHGDSSIYGAMVRLSQNWIMRYPLIDWHGSNGNINGDGPAASRYTEARLSKLAEDGMLNNLKKKNVDFTLNYSEDSEEPITLPSLFPNLLCNPNTGIGVAMACNWLPHNLKEVADAIINYMEDREYSLPGPDFPTGGIITNKNDIPNIMKTGHGSVKVRGKYKIEKNNIVFYEIPYGETIEGILNEIGAVCEEKEIEGITNVRDETNKKGIRIVIECNKNVDLESIVKKLFIKTNLQTSISYNQVALVDKSPVELNLEDCIKIYISHNLNCIVKEANFDLNKAIDRLEIVNGLIRALEDIDTIISFIKKSSSSTAAKEGLIKEFNFSEPQAKAIVDMKLGKLANLEKIELNNEKADLDKTVENLKSLIANVELQKNLLKERLLTLVKKYGDERKTELMQIEMPKEEKEIEMVTPEDVVVVINKIGEIKRISKNSFRVQRKGGKGVKTESDAILSTIKTNTIDNLLLFTNKGKMFKILVDNIPVGTNISKGINIASLINLEPSEKVIAVTSLERKNNKKYVVFITKQGLLKKTLLEEYTKTKRSTGIAAIKIKENDSIANIEIMDEEDMLIITKKGMSILFSTKEISAIGRVTSGIKAIKLDDDDEVLVGLPIVNKDEKIAVFTEYGQGKKVSLNDFNMQSRGGKGVFIYKTNPSTGVLVGAVNVNEEDNILLTGKTVICISAKEVPELSRTATGNIMVKNNSIKSIIKI